MQKLFDHLIDKDHPAFDPTGLIDRRIHPDDNFDNIIKVLKEIVSIGMFFMLFLLPVESFKPF
jgi:hypothetical protein